MHWEIILIICKYNNASMKSEPDNLWLVSWAITFYYRDDVAHWHISSQSLAPEASLHSIPLKSKA